MKDTHCFGIGAWMSCGISGASINAMDVAVPKFAAGVSRGLIRCRARTTWVGLQAYSESQVMFCNDD
jgi:hypothetical protein